MKLIEIAELYHRWSTAPEEKKKMSLLPLLEYGYPRGAELIRSHGHLPADELVHLIEFALQWPTGGGWSLLAVEWMEKGFPLNDRICELLLKNSQNKQKYKQNERHRVFRLAKRWLRTKQI